jgi:hypothetical protein
VDRYLVFAIGAVVAAALIGAWLLNRRARGRKPRGGRRY